METATERISSILSILLTHAKKVVKGEGSMLFYEATLREAAGNNHYNS